MNRPANDDIAIRTAESADYDAILSVWRESGLSIRPLGRDRCAAFLEQLTRFPASYLVAVDRDRVVGVVFGTHDERKGWINRLAVVPEYRGRGVADALVAACEDALRACGIGIIAALVEPENQASTALFRKIGYVTDVPVLYFRKLTSPDV